MCLDMAICIANSVDPDQMPHSVASDLGLHCLQKPTYPNTYVGLIRNTSINPMRSPRNIFFIQFSEMIHFTNIFNIT